MSETVCLITGVGPGTGASLARRFGASGYRVAMLARDSTRLGILEHEIPGAMGFVCDVADGVVDDDFRRAEPGPNGRAGLLQRRRVGGAFDAAALEETCTAVRARLGAPEVVIHNAVGGAFGDFQTIDPGVLRHNFEVNTMALLMLARATAPDMIAAGKGAILCTGNTSAHRGVASFAGFAPTKAAQRILAQSIARSLAPHGVHVAYVTIDAVIDVAWTRQLHADKPDEFFIQPDDIAEECWHVVHQPRSAWSCDVEIRPFGERW
jgi:NADP-dependent 3-hydroxy acid dehydrogenase YdfG